MLFTPAHLFTILLGIWVVCCERLPEPSLRENRRVSALLTRTVALHPVRERRVS